MKRLTESKLGLILGIVLAMVWIVSMSVADANVCTTAPLLWALAGVVGAATIGIACGLKVVRLPLTAWLSLGIGCYFLWRATCGCSHIDNLENIVLILGATVFYLSGVYSGQAESSKGCTLVLCLALLLNILYFYLLKDENLSLNWAGRADTSLAGPNTRNTSLFVYKNFAGLFLSAGGILLLWRYLWRGNSGLRGVPAVLIGLASVAISLHCSTRAPILVLPLMFVVGWVLWLIVRLYEQRPIGWGIICGGGLLFVLLGIAVYDFLFASTIKDFIANADSHHRYEVWDYVSYSANKAPLWGYGPGGATWHHLADFKVGYLPNYAHNEYLQCWADYGTIGIMGMVLILLLHTIQGFLTLACEKSSHERRVRTAMALAMLCLLSAACATDYGWHSFALVSLTAYSCGTLASPHPTPAGGILRRRYVARESGSEYLPVKAETRTGRVLISALGLALAAALCRNALLLTPIWQKQLEYDSLVAQGASVETRREFLSSCIRMYPYYRVAEHYLTMAPTQTPDWQSCEQALRAVLEANPRQLYIAAALAQVLSKQAKYEEAEDVYRSYYPEDGIENNGANCWATHYTANLQKWGHSLLSTPGGISKAYSILTHAENIAKKQKYLPGLRWRSGIHTWTPGGTKAQREAQKYYYQDFRLLRLINPPRDDSWKSPLRPGGQPALYQRFQKNENEHS